MSDVREDLKIELSVGDINGILAAIEPFEHDELAVPIKAFEGCTPLIAAGIEDLDVQPADYRAFLLGYLRAFSDGAKQECVRRTDA